MLLLPSASARVDALVGRFRAMAVHVREVTESPVRSTCYKLDGHHYYYEGQVLREATMPSFPPKEMMFDMMFFRQLFETMAAKSSGEIDGVFDDGGERWGFWTFELGEENSWVTGQGNSNFSWELLYLHIIIMFWTKGLVFFWGGVWWVSVLKCSFGRGSGAQVSVVALRNMSARIMEIMQIEDPMTVNFFGDISKKTPSSMKS